VAVGGELGRGVEKPMDKRATRRMPATAKLAPCEPGLWRGSSNVCGENQKREVFGEKMPGQGEWEGMGHGGKGNAGAPGGTPRRRTGRATKTVRTDIGELGLEGRNRQNANLRK